MGRTRHHTRRTPRSNPRGVLIVRAGGYGFVQTAEGEYFVPRAKMGGAFDGDTVEVAPLPTRGGKTPQPHERHGSEKPAARVVRVLERAHVTIVGRYEVAEPFGVVVPSDPRIPYDIFTMRADRPDIADGSLVRVRIDTYPTARTAVTGTVEEVLGRDEGDAVPVDVVVARHKLETSFSEESRAEACAAVLDASGALADGYRDVRDRLVFTIDPADARDFDDALSLEAVDAQRVRAGGAEGASRSDSPGSHEGATGAPSRAGKRFVNSPLDCSPCGTRFVTPSAPSALQGGCSVPRSVHVLPGRSVAEAVWRLGVHIADVSWYVPWNSSLDLEARRRATSVYLVDRVIPMLPEELSNGLCSLNPGEDRRCMTCDLYLDAAARVVAYDLYPALMHSQYRLNYDEVQRVLGDLASREDAALSASASAEPPANLPADLVSRLCALDAIARKRVTLREAAGGLDFDTAEAKVRLDGEGHPVDIDVREKTRATSLVEEAMILTNETVAAHLRDAGFPGVFRVHEQPAADSLAALVPVFQEFAWFGRIDVDKFVAGSPHELQAVLAAVRGRSEEALVSSLLLRAMKRAVYRTECAGHYGLALDAYAHFTSPIRRYPDLVVHRMLRAQLTRRPNKFDQEVAALPWIAEHSSDMERVAEAAARESQEIKMIEYLQRFIGQSFSAVVSGVAAYGLYVQLDNTAEGIVPVRDLGPEYFSLDAAEHRLTGQDSGRSYRLGQRVPVTLAVADPRARRLEFRLVKPAPRP